MTEATKLTYALVDGQWGWLDWAIVVGLILLIVGFILTYAYLTKNIFNRQIGVLSKALEEQSKALDERARTLYLEHLPLVYEQLDREVKRIEEVVKERVTEHDKDILFLLQEQERLEDMVKGKVSPATRNPIQLNEDEMTKQALKILLARIRRDAM